MVMWEQPGGRLIQTDGHAINAPLRPPPSHTCILDWNARGLRSRMKSTACCRLGSLSWLFRHCMQQQLSQ